MSSFNSLAALNSILQKLFHLLIVWDAFDNTEYLKQTWPVSYYVFCFVQFAIRGSADTATGSDEEQLDGDLSCAESHVPVIHGKGKE